MSKERVVLPETREALVNLFPAAFENPDYLRLLEHLLFSTFVDEDNEDFVVVDAATLARIQGQERVHQGRNYKGGSLLEAFNREVLTLELSEHRYIEGKARTARRPTSPELGKVLQREFTSSRAERQERGVFLLTGQRLPKQPPRKQVEAHKAAQDAHIARIQRGLSANHPAADWLDFLNTQPDRALKRIVHDNLEFARQQAINSSGLAKTTKAYNLRVLHDIEDGPKPLYQPSADGKTVRLFPVGSSYLSLSREIRKALMVGCYEFDLAAAQLTLGAHVWGVPSLQNQVLQDKLLKPWAMLAKRAGIPVSPSNQTFAQKAALKTGVYALLFGGGEKTVMKALMKSSSGALGLTQAQAEQFMTSEVVQDIVTAQRAREAQFKTSGGFTDAFGRWIPVLADGKTRTLKSLLAEELQSYELFVLKPGLDYLMKLGNNAVTVMAWQHDGLTLHFKDASKSERYIRELNRRVRHQAIHVLGIPWWKFELEGVKL